MSEYLSSRKRNLNIGISSYTENKLVLDVIGNTNISGISSLGITFANSLKVSGTSTLGITSTTDLTSKNLKVSGISTISTLNVGTGGTIVTITDTGLVGIGTTNPTRQLSVSGNIGIGGSIFDSTGFSGSNQYVLTSTPNGVLWQSVTGVGAILGLNISETTEDVVNYIPFINVSYGTTAVAYVSDTQLTYNPSTNNLGIGTTNATSKLTVYGDGRFSGVVTATRFVGNLDGAIAFASTAINLRGGDASQIPYQVSPGITSFIPNGTPGYLLKSNGTNVPSWIGVQELAIDYATSSGIATYATNAGVSTSVIGGIGSITQLQVTGVSTFTNGPVLIGTGTSTGSSSQPLQVTGGAYVSQNLGIGTTTPSSKLHVVGNTLVSGVTTSSEFVGGASDLRNLSGTHLVSYASAADISNSALSISGISTYNQVGVLTGTYAIDTNDNFGRSLVTSADGKTIIVGAHADELSGTSGYGLVYIYDRVGNSYNQVGILTGSYAVDANDAFGRSLATSADGKTIVVGAISDEISDITGYGLVYVFDRVGNSYNQVGILTGTYAVDANDAFGRSVATSADGKTIVVSASSDEISDTTGYGLVYVFDRVGNAFNQVGILTGSYASQSSDNFGISVATSSDGKTIVVGTYNDEIGTPSDTGIVYVYDRVGSSFNQVGILTGSYAVATNDNFGISVATSADGKTIIVGAQYDEIGTPNDTGLVYVFDRVGNSFNQVGILTGSYATQANDTFGLSVATSADGKTIVVGAQYDEISGGATSTGIAYIFKRQGNSYNQVGILTGSYAVDTNDYFGISVATSADGKTIVVGAIFDEIGGITNTGVVYVFDETRDTYIYSGPTGNIGIGITNPTSKLHVVGDGRFTGVVTATTFVGNLTGIASTAINLQGGAASQIAYQVSPGITSFIPNGSSGYLLKSNGTNVPSWVNPAFGFNVSNADYALVAGVSTDVIGGIGSLTQLQVTGISTFTNGPVLIGTETSTGTESQPLQVTGGAYVSDNLGIGATNPTSKLHVEGDGRFTGVVTATTFIGNLDGYASSSGISTYATNAGIASTATKLENIRTFEITGDIVAAPQDFDGTANVSFASSIQPNTVGLGTHTYGDYVKNITGTTGEIEVSVTSGEGVSPQIGLPDNVTISNSLTVTNDVQINRNLNVTGNITIGGTSAYLSVENLVVKDRDIIAGFVTDAYGNDISTDISANTGGIAIASTEGTPIVDLNVVGFETIAPTYKKIMWFKANTFVGLNTDAWMFNYGVGIGSTQIPNGVRLAVGGVQVTDSDIIKIRNINASGIITASTFVGNVSGIGSTAINLQGGAASQIAYQVSPGITSFIANGTPGWLLQSDGSNVPYWVNPAFGFNVSNADYAIVAGIATYATNAGIATYATNAGIATYATSSGIATYATNAGVSTSVIGGIGSITQLQVTGVSTFTNGPVLIGAATSTGTASQPLQVTGGAYVSGNLGIGTTNPTSKLTISSALRSQALGIGSEFIVSDTGSFVPSVSIAATIGSGTTEKVLLRSISRNQGTLDVVSNYRQNQMMNVSDTNSEGVFRVTALETSTVAFVAPIYRQLLVVGESGIVTTRNAVAIATANATSASGTTGADIYGNVNIRSPFSTSTSYVAIAPNYRDRGALSFEAPIGAASTNSVTQLFSITNNVSSSIFRINDLNRNPILEANVAGNIGIGTTNPQRKLEIQGITRISSVGSTANEQIDIRHYRNISGFATVGMGSTSFLPTNNSGAISFESPVGYSSFTSSLFAIVNDPNGSIFSIAGFNPQRFANDPRIPALEITQVGNVGLGTTNPVSKFHIIGNTRIVGNVGIGTTTVDTSRDFTSSSGVIQRLSTQIAGAARITSLGSTTLSQIDIKHQSNPGINTLAPSRGAVFFDGLTDTFATNFDGGQLVTITNDNTSSIFAVNRFVPGLAGLSSANPTNTRTIETVVNVTSGGNVGIGTSIPSSRLDVRGNVLVSGIVTATTFGGNFTGIASLTQLQVTGISTFTNGPILIGSGTSTGTTSHPLQVTGGAYVSGNFGIGATNPTSKLHVVGDALITGISTVGLGSTSSPSVNSTMSFELTNNTTLTVRVRGTDGTIRTGIVTLS
jgi:hypothetical protein